MSFTEEFKAKYAQKPQNLPINEQKKPSLSVCRSCSQFEEGEKVGRVPPIGWCISKYFDRRIKRPIVCYRNIALMDQCPKKIDRK